MDRKYWLEKLVEIVDPVLREAGKDKLKERMSLEGSPERLGTAHLEGISRSLLGIASWLESNEEEERELRERYAVIARSSIKNLVDPLAKDYGGYDTIIQSDFGTQHLVEAAILSMAILKAPVELWEKLDTDTKNHVKEALGHSRKIVPAPNNWVLFTAMVEVFFMSIDEEFSFTKIDWALERMEKWYVGGGYYSDGDEFILDYYNSLIIHPMLLEILYNIRIYADKKKTKSIDEGYYDVTPTKYFDKFEKYIERAEERAKKYAVTLERFIGADGSYTPMGRSLAYRFGVFYHLTNMALLNKLPEELPANQVRSGLTEVLKRTMESSILNKEGYLKIGIMGPQPDYGEVYINTGSLYYCTTIFTALGLQARNEFWSAPEKGWTSKRIFGS